VVDTIVSKPLQYTRDVIHSLSSLMTILHFGCYHLLLLQDYSYTFIHTLLEIGRMKETLHDIGINWNNYWYHDTTNLYT
jgi:hypothetical protein